MSEPFMPTWRDRAVCREADPEAFFPPRGGSARPAKRVCSRCPVAAECLDEALSYPASEDFGIRGGLPEVHDHGVWGGTSAYERRRLRRERAGRLAPVVTLPVPSVPQQQPGRAA